jgi:adenylyltransferase/sulfurtransferase
VLRALRDLRAQVPEVDPAALAGELSAAGPIRVIALDVRDAEERADGGLVGATWIPRGYLELRVERAIPDLTTPIVIYCAGGTRSLLAARSLRELGYLDVRSLAGGFTAWKRRGLPWELPATLRADQAVRYSRHTLLPEVGVAGQRRLLAAKVLCLGAGGLGSPAAMYLAAAGVGTLGIVDDDVVDASNLQRQILHGTDRVGRAKVDSAEDTIGRLNPDVRVVKHRARLRAANALELLAGYDVILDGADNFPTRYLLNDAALRLGTPVVHASVFRFEGQLTVFGAAGGPCYRCLFAAPPAPEDAPSCAEAGVLGVLPGVMGVLQATEAIKLVLGIGEPLAGRLVLYDALRARFRELRIRRDPRCPACGEGVARDALALVDLDASCARPAPAG